MDESYGQTNDQQYNLSDVPGIVLDWGTNEVEGVGKVEAKSYWFDMDGELSPQAVTANIRSTGYFSYLPNVPGDPNQITSTHYFNKIWASSPEDVYFDVAYKTQDWIDGNNNSILDRSVFSGSYDDGTNVLGKKTFCCGGGSEFIIDGNSTSMIKFTDDFGGDINNSEYRTKNVAYLDSITPTVG
jgi:hypothetical protein